MCGNSARFGETQNDEEGGHRASTSESCQAVCHCEAAIADGFIDAVKDSLCHERRCAEPRKIENRFHGAGERRTFHNQAKKLICIEGNDADGVIENQDFVFEEELISIHEQNLNQVRVVLASTPFLRHIARNEESCRFVA